ncbi:MAG: PA2169 family four-helix-bundle protein [Chitinophagales bacterium]
MEDSSKKITATLNELVQINHDRCEGYKVAADETNDADLKALFGKHAQQSESFARDLAQQVIEFGDQPVEGTRTDGKLHRIWMDIKAAITGNDRKAILNSCEYGEDVALRNYEDVLTADVILPPSTRQLISRQKRDLMEAHQNVKRLRDAHASVERNVF